MIAAELWKKLESSDESRGEALVKLAFDHLVAERWIIAEGVSCFMMKDKGISERMQIIGQINYWQSLKWQDRFGEIQEEVEKADFSAKDEVFRLGRLALLDAEEDFFEMLPNVLDAEKISVDDLQTWPLFRKMRDTETYRLKYGSSDQSADDSEVNGELAPDSQDQ